jgi:hypothetical protein
MPRLPSSFAGPSAPWIDSDDQTYTYTLAEAAEELKRSLKARIAALDATTDAPIDVLLTEIRVQIAEAAVRGDIVRAGDLNDLAQEICSAHHERSRDL